MLLHIFPLHLFRAILLVNVTRRVFYYEYNLDISSLLFSFYCLLQWESGLSRYYYYHSRTLIIWTGSRLTQISAKIDIFG